MSGNINCNYCNSCNSCKFCKSCKFCDYCKYCDYCYSCYYCKNLRMTEYNIFCYSERYDDGDSLQQQKYRAFNKEVGNDRYYGIKTEVDNIFNIFTNSKGVESLREFWRAVTNKQWRELLSIPEAKGFEKGFEYISGQKIEWTKKHKIKIDGKEFEISDESYKEFSKQFK